MTRCYAAVLPLLVVAAFAVAPALAQAEPYWTSNGKVIKESQAEVVTTSGTLTLHGSILMSCKVKDTETIENPAGGGAGVDEVTAFTLTGCKGKLTPCLPSEKLTAVKTTPNWPSELVPSIRDEISGVELEVKCNGTTIATYTGELRPLVTASSSLEFGSGSGELESGPKKLTISGIDKLKGPSGDTKIGAEEVEHEPHWYSDGTRIIEATSEPVATSGSVVITALSSTIKCKLTDSETIENPLGGGAGVDKATAFSLTGCKASPPLCLPAEKLTLPASSGWPSELLPGTQIRDEISGMEIAIKCNSTTLATFTGELMPVVTSASALQFGAGSGELESGTKKMTISGADKLTGPSGDTTITAEDP